MEQKTNSYAQKLLNQLAQKHVQIITQINKIKAELDDKRYDIKQLESKIGLLYNDAKIIDNQMSKLKSQFNSLCLEMNYRRTPTDLDQKKTLGLVVR